MQFANIIREAGLPQGNFPKASTIPAIVYSGKERFMESEVTFVEPLFKNSNFSKSSFETFVKEMDESPVAELKIHINENVVSIYYDDSHMKLFFRNH